MRLRCERECPFVCVRPHLVILKEKSCKHCVLKQLMSQLCDAFEPAVKISFSQCTPPTKICNSSILEDRSKRPKRSKGFRHVHARTMTTPCREKAAGTTDKTKGCVRTSSRRHKSRRQRIRTSPMGGPRARPPWAPARAHGGGYLHAVFHLRKENAMKQTYMLPMLNQFSTCAQAQLTFQVRH